MQIDSVGVDVLHIHKRSAPVLTKLHDVADVFLRRIDMRVGNGLLRRLDKRRVWIVGRVVDVFGRAVGAVYLIDNAGRGGDKFKHILALKALLNDLHMKQAEEAAAEAKAQSDRGLRLKGERGVVELQLFERVLKVAVLGAVKRINAAEHHRLSLAVTGERLGGRVVCKRNGVTHLCVGKRFD